MRVYIKMCVEVRRKSTFWKLARNGKVEELGVVADLLLQRGKQVAEGAQHRQRACVVGADPPQEEGLLGVVREDGHAHSTELVAVGVEPFLHIHKKYMNIALVWIRCDLFTVLKDEALPSKTTETTTPRDAVSHAFESSRHFALISPRLSFESMTQNKSRSCSSVKSLISVNSLCSFTALEFVVVN